MSATTLPIDPAAFPDLDQCIAVRAGYCGGKPHLAGHRIKVQQVAVWHEQLGQSPEEIVATYPGLTLAAVHAALAYYHAHRDQIDADIRADEEFAAKLRAAGEASPLTRKLGDRHAPNEGYGPFDGRGLL